VTSEKDPAWEEPSANGKADSEDKHFEDLTRKLVRVPKREVQEAEARREKRPRR